MGRHTVKRDLEKERDAAARFTVYHTKFSTSTRSQTAIGRLAKGGATKSPRTHGRATDGRRQHKPFGSRGGSEPTMMSSYRSRSSVTKTAK